MERTLVKLQGLPVDTFTFEKAIEYALNISGQIVTINPEMITYAKKNPDFKNIIENAQLIIPDGIGVELGLKILGKSVKRIAGIEFAKTLLVEFSKKNSPVALVGAKEEIITKAKENLEKEIEGMNIVYSHNGYFEDDEKILADLAKSNPRYVLIALGSPKQEKFINKAKKLMPEALFIGIGGSFDVWSGVVERAPEIYQKIGLEWLYRTIKEPKRFKRIFPTLPLFVLNVLKEKFIGV